MSDRMRGARGGPGAAYGAKGPDELRLQIAQTRSRLGDTVEELAYRADVKSRAKARASGLKNKAGTMTGQLRSGASQAAHRAQEKAAHATHTVQERRAARAHRHDGHKQMGGTGRTGSDIGPAGTQEGVGEAGSKGGQRSNKRSLLTGGGTAAALTTAGVLLRRRRARRRQTPNGPLETIQYWGTQARDKVTGTGTGSRTWGRSATRTTARAGRKSWCGKRS
ncbi:DUF3618 domain-containing protein [Streptomyces macrolidinus]|uniref:DUF3618 domain-containing protein n=1 Tax=Streptomyces macrolidinus TaxID=2952607 RepID=UPI0027E2FDB1|nr:DUF3618 domain-containing protein [Streptomyces macrolidinus]